MVRSMHFYLQTVQNSRFNSVLVQRCRCELVFCEIPNDLILKRYKVGGSFVPFKVKIYSFVRIASLKNGKIVLFMI